jgi:putative Mg2+ transporter-C (MgtC) family protein
LDITPQWSAAVQIELIARLALSLGLGAVIGFERARSRQPAGLRTHMLVAVGSCLFTIISAYGFQGSAVDPTRIAAQIVSGIGFIGAGAILHERGSIKGLTTAASLWAMAAVGMASGAGLYILALVGTAMILATLWILERVADAARDVGVLPPDPDESAKPVGGNGE